MTCGQQVGIYAISSEQIPQVLDFLIMKAFKGQNEEKQIFQKSCDDGGGKLGSSSSCIWQTLKWGLFLVLQGPLNH